MKSGGWWIGGVLCAFGCNCGGGGAPEPVTTEQVAPAGGEGEAPEAPAGPYVPEPDPWDGDASVVDLCPSAAGGIAIHRMVQTYADDGDEAFLLRYELDATGTPLGPPKRLVDLEPLTMVLETALVGESTLVVTASEGETDGYVYEGLWLDAAGDPRGERFTIARAPSDAFDLLVAPHGRERARVIVSGPIQECALDGEVDTQDCPTWVHYWVPVTGEPSVAIEPEGTPDGANVMLAGSTRGSVYVDTAPNFGGGISVGIEVDGVDAGSAPDGFAVPEIEGFVIAEGRVAILAADYDAVRDRIGVYGADGAAFEERAPRGSVELPLGSSALGCAGDVPVARVRMQSAEGEVVVEVRAGDRGGSAPWHLWMSDTTPSQLSSVATARAVFTMAPELPPGQLARVTCRDGQRRDDRVTWLRVE